MTTTHKFSLRPLGGRSPSALEGGFRVHLSENDLAALGLVTGDVCRLTAPNGASGLGIAWLASRDINASNKCIAKVTATLRETYGIKLEDRVSIDKVDEAWRPADAVSLTPVNPSRLLEGYASIDEFQHWAASALEELDLIVPNCTIEVLRKGGRHHQNSAKIRLLVDSVETLAAGSGPVYFDYCKTQIQVKDVGITEKPESMIQIDDGGVGGLATQIEVINDRLLDLSAQGRLPSDHPLDGPTAMLIHGQEGTGKSLLLSKLAQAPFRKSFLVDRKWLLSHIKEPSKALLEVFDHARASQPSVILMEELDKLLAKAADLCSDLREQLDSLRGERVLVAATARSVFDIDACLRTDMAFGTEIEIFPPNVQQREDIIRKILGNDRISANIQYVTLAERTHGFVGRDLRSLCGKARKHTRSRSMLLGSQQSHIKDVENYDIVTQNDFDAVIDQIQPTVMKEVVLELPKVKWADIGGLDHVRQLLHEVTVRPFKYPDLATKFGSTQSRKGLLLYGPPGCAKTLIAQAVATESNQNFLAVKGSELIKMYVGESERAIRDVFRRARSAKPCIIFFDEIDSIGKSRDKSHDSGLNVVTTLLNEMDGIETLKDVFVIGATNRPDILDSALIRVGRFDAHIHVGLPDVEARKQIWHIHTKTMPLTADVDLQVLAKKTDGHSGADIKGLCAVAVDAAMTEFEKDPTKQPEVKMCHFEQALSMHKPHITEEEAKRYENWRPGISLTNS
ncbi:AAA-domain-containing protein [Lepidopterella palustris CBS 459.81]|uniref:AAA-domain-containing protein n=1 Tax=Lepidopterella palustris CBS 459.81 TaxID=1314670 RepID=A0A8E2EM69_9PEZI|nr:AAA-domain-containing protein [Lepidopterella palustris CBS 459.81]